MNLYQYSWEDAQVGACPFRDDYADDLWVAYHGTSNHTETEIDRVGFAWRDHTYSKAEVDTVLDVFDRLHWSGAEPEGPPVLASFTQSDFALDAHGNRKPIFFAETGNGAVLYAQRDWAGGETARALRRAFADLDRYLESTDFRHQALVDSWRNLRQWYSGSVPDECHPDSEAHISYAHLRALWKFYEAHGARPGLLQRPGVEPIDFSEAWLRSRLEALGPIRDRCEHFLTTFAYGVVYAVRFFVSDLDDLHYGNGGLKALRPIPAERILAKAIIDPAVRYARGAGRDLTGLDPVSRGRLRAWAGDGVVGSVRRRGAV